MKEKTIITLKKLCSCLLFSLLIMGLFSTAKPAQAAGTTSDLLSQIEPYHTYRYSTGDASLGGVDYTDCLLFNTYNSVTGSASFYLEGNYQSLTFCTAHVSGKQTRTVSVYCDDVLVWSEDVLADDLPSSHTASIDLTNVQKLKFVVGGSSSSFQTAIANMNLVSKSGYTQEERKATVTSNMLTNVQAYNSSRYSTGEISIGDKTYENGLAFNTYNSVTGHATFNLQGNYKSLSFYVGNASNSASSQTRTITITGDGTEIYSQAVSVDTAPKYATISVEGVHQLKITVSGTASSYKVVIVGANLTSNGIVQSISLDQDKLALSYENPTSYLKPTIVPTDANPTVTWTSSDTNIATVNDQGLVTAIGNGTATITATTQSGGYTALCTVNVTGMPVHMTKTAISVASDHVYSGNAIVPIISVTYDGKTLKAGTDYAVSYTNNTNAGTATVTFTGMGDYNGTVTKNFTIGKATQELTASVSKTTLVVGKSTQIQPSGYGTITYVSSNPGIATVSSSGKIKAVSPGTVTITVKADGGSNHNADSETISVTVRPKSTKILSVKNTGRKQATVKWQKVSGVSGYEIRYVSGSTKKVSTIKRAAVSSKKIKKLQVGRTYKVSIRTYKKVAGKKYYSTWSKAKRVKITK